MLDQCLSYGLDAIFLLNVGIISGTLKQKKLLSCGHGSSATIAFGLTPINLVLFLTWPLTFFTGFNAKFLVKGIEDWMKDWDAPEEVKENADPQETLEEMKARILSDPKRKGPCLGCCLPLIIALFFASGIVCLFFGVQGSNDLRAIIQPEEAFDFLGPACTISRIGHDAKVIQYSTSCGDYTGSDSNNNANCKVQITNYCVDYYEYWFTLDKTGAKEYKADIEWHNEFGTQRGMKIESHERTGENFGNCTLSTPSDSNYIKNQIVDCWAPKVPMEEIEDAKRYFCTNDECIKVNDPAKELKGLDTLHLILKIVGSVLSCIALACLLIYRYLSYKQSEVVKKYAAEKRTNQHILINSGAAVPAAATTGNPKNATYKARPGADGQYEMVEQPAMPSILTRGENNAVL
jgi:hypothetical protein